MVFFTFYDYRKFEKKILILIGISIGLLLLVRFAGQERLGAQRWIMIGPFSLQPSEFVKVMVILILGAFITKNYNDESLFVEDDDENNENCQDDESKVNPIILNIHTLCEKECDVLKELFTK